MKVILNESQLRTLMEMDEGGGVHSDGQMDLFLDQEDMDKFKEDGNKKLLDILKQVESECGWAHDSVKDIEKPDCIIHKCYPMGYFYKHKPVYRHEFVKELCNRIPNKYLKTSFPMTAIRPEDWYVDVTIKKV